MGLPLFSASDDPGPSFFHLRPVQRLTPPVSNASAASAHATTVIAVLTPAGVVMVGDLRRRATTSPAVTFERSKRGPVHGLAISGTPRAGIEVHRMAQLSFEHYEKMTDTALSLEGQRRTTSRPIIQRNNLSFAAARAAPARRLGPVPAGGRNLRYDGAEGLLRTLDRPIGSFELPSPKEPCDCALTPRWTVTQPSSSARWRCTSGDNDPSTGDRTSYEPLSHDRHISSEGFQELAPDDVAERFRVINERRTQSAESPAAHCDEAIISTSRPEQLIRDRAELRRTGIARAAPSWAAIFDNGVCWLAENPSASLFKISEIYDRIAFAGVGKYNEFDRLREAGIRWADSTGFTYSRGDVTSGWRCSCPSPDGPPHHDAAVVTHGDDGGRVGRPALAFDTGGVSPLDWRSGRTRAPDRPRR